MEALAHNNHHPWRKPVQQNPGWDFETSLQSKRVVCAGNATVVGNTLVCCILALVNRYRNAGLRGSRNPRSNRVSPELTNVQRDVHLHSHCSRGLKSEFWKDSEEAAEQCSEYTDVILQALDL